MMIIIGVIWCYSAINISIISTVLIVAIIIVIIVVVVDIMLIVFFRYFLEIASKWGRRGKHHPQVRVHLRPRRCRWLWNVLLRHRFLQRQLANAGDTSWRSCLCPGSLSAQGLNRRSKYLPKS